MERECFEPGPVIILPPQSAHHPNPTLLRASQYLSLTLPRLLLLTAYVVYVIDLVALDEAAAGG
jgi:hypothetical protein